MSKVTIPAKTGSDSVPDHGLSSNQVQPKYSKSDGRDGDDRLEVEHTGRVPVIVCPSIEGRHVNNRQIPERGNNGVFPGCGAFANSK